MTANRTAMGPTGTDDPARGFRATLSGTSLGDLVQMECTRGVRSVARVRSGAQVGYIYFDLGRIVHAVTGSLRGEEALFAILEWSTGEFQPCEMPWPAQPTLHDSASSLLIRAAYVQDEAARRATPPDGEDRGATLLSFPEIRPTPSQSQLMPAAQVATPPPVPDDAKGVLGSLRLGADFEPTTRTGDVDALAPTVAYVVCLAALVADRLGLEPLDALHAELGGEHLFVTFEGEETHAVRARPGPALDALRTKHRI